MRLLCDHATTMRAFVVSAHGGKPDGLIECRCNGVMRSKMNPLERAAGIRHQAANDGTADTVTPVLRRNVQAPNATDAVAARKRIDVQTANPAGALAPLRDVGSLARPIEPIATIPPLLDEPRHHGAPVGPSVRFELDQLREVDKGLNDEVTWSHNAADQRRAAYSAEIALYPYRARCIRLLCAAAP